MELLHLGDWVQDTYRVSSDDIGCELLRFFRASHCTQQHCCHFEGWFNSLGCYAYASHNFTNTAAIDEIGNILKQQVLKYVDIPLQHAYVFHVKGGGCSEVYVIFLIPIRVTQKTSRSCSMYSNGTTNLITGFPGETKEDH